MMPLSHLIEPPHQPDQVVLVRHLVVKEGVAPHPAGKAEGDKQGTGLHPVGSPHLTVGAEDQASASQALRLPTARPTDEMILCARAGDVFPTGHARRPEVHLDGRVDCHHVDENLWRTVGSVAVQPNSLRLGVVVVVHLNACVGTHHYS